MLDRARSTFHAARVRLRDLGDRRERGKYRHQTAAAWFEAYQMAQQGPVRDLAAEREPRRADPGRVFQAPARDAQRRAAELWRNRVEAVRGLGASGADGLPFALQMLRDRDAEVRADGAGVLMLLGNDPAVVAALLDRLAVETDLTTADSIVVALGRMHDPRIIPALATLVRTHEDGDTVATAVDSIERLANRRWRGVDRIAAAKAWLDEAGF